MTDFICPVEGCDLVYADWETLREHLAGEHGETVAQESYTAWKASMNELESASASRSKSGNLNISDNQTPDRTDIEDPPEDIDERMFTLRCPKCDKPFSRETESAAFRSVRAHCQKVHRIRLKRADFGLPEEGEGGRSPARKPSERIHPPDDLEELSDQLVTFRLSSKNADSVCEYMKGYSTDNLPRLNYALEKTGMPVDRKRMFLERWISVRGIDVDPRLGDELGLWLQESRYDRRGTGGTRGYYRRDDELQERRIREDEVKRAREDGFMLGQILSRLERIEENARAPYRTPQEDELERDRQEKISNLESKLEEKDQKLEQEREMRHQTELRDLEERMTLRIEAMERETGTIVERQGVKAAERIGDLGEKMVNLGEKIIVSTAFKHGILEPEPPVPRERGGPGGIAGLLPPELIERLPYEAAEA